MFTTQNQLAFSDAKTTGQLQLVSPVVSRLKSLCTQSLHSVGLSACGFEAHLLVPKIRIEQLHLAIATTKKDTTNPNAKSII